MRPALAVASSFVLEVARRRSSIACVLAVGALAVVLPGLPGGVGDLRSRLQRDASYGLGFPLILIALATISLAAGAIALDADRRRLDLVATKPAGRWQIVLGKLLGVLAVDAALLAAVLLGFAFRVEVIDRGRGASAEDVAAARDRFFTPRRKSPSEPPPVDPAALARLVKEIEESEEDGGRPGPTRREIEARARRALSRLRVEPGKSAALRFQGLESEEDPGGRIFIRAVIHTSPPGLVPRFEVRWLQPDPPGAPVASSSGATGVPHETRVPAALAAGGSLRLLLENPAGANQSAVLIAEPSAIEALYPSGRFWPNVLRAFAAAFASLFFLASVCILGSALFTFPTASLLGLFFYITGLGSSFFLDTFADALAGPAGDSTLEVIEKALARFGKLVLRLLPDWAAIDPVERLAGGLAVPPDELAARAGWTVFVQGGIALAAAAFFFSRRELGSKRGS
jgi:hypothetical protein